MAAVQDKAKYYIAQLNKELDKYPALVQFEQQTRVPKTYVTLGAGGLLLLLIFFNIAAGFLTNLLGFVPATYYSFKAIESKSAADDTQWLTYWVVFSFIHIIEYFTDIILYWMPFYFVFKAVLIVWLLLPQFSGAQVLYHTVFRPVVAKYTNILGSDVSSLKGKLNAATSDQ